jgi:hypothetical protein
MREIVFLVTAEHPDRIEAKAPDRGLVVEAPTLEELHHEARDAVISQVGPSHTTYRIRIRRASDKSIAASGDHPTEWHPFRRARPVPAGKQAGASRGTERAHAVELTGNSSTGLVTEIWTQMDR